ncbi:right-handed parallel beta-helix repeat-containing protein [Nitriliruptor alkaliphilus]|uniref:right-handed parallel beta-helix repeat-containing protein n=1 Tax=Nitriliruptor alkaliphilus TaxID=427918 RepID=UPI000695E185|nr:right-handed parallel beta-helix repeat-containing protein [Nitriliruptor alkaliphilus]
MVHVVEQGRTVGRRGGLALVLALLVLGLVGGPAVAHEERASQFPPGGGSTPELRTIDEAADVIVVCKDGVSADRIRAISDPQLRAFNRRLLRDCAHQHIQLAVDAVEVQGTNIYVLPGVYREQPSWDENQPCTDDYDDGVVEYDLIVSCGAVVNLVTIAGDDPDDDDIVCDNQLCHLQIAGTGERAEDTALRGGFKEDGSWIKHNGLKADRADGFVLSNMAFQVFRENAIYVHETDGYLLDNVVASHNDLYGILTFTSDHGLIRDCDTAFNGDSGIYPGSAADVNADNDVTGPLERWAVEITGCRSHHNALGFSGSAGNSVWFHDNDVFLNAAGYVTDSFVPDHPGMPQDHAFLENNRLFMNNVNYFERYVQAGRCGGKPADRGYETGTVCPAFPVPVGTGMMVAGGNHNLVRDNDIFDNWRQGAMLFWVPSAIRDEFDDQFDTSNHNHYVGNRMGANPDGLVQPNGVDFWWDEQGVGNCWQDNTSATGEVTTNATLPLEDVTGGAVPFTGFPDCDSGGSLFPVGSVVKSAGLVPCATYDREDEPDPPLCDWFDSPAAPADREAPEGEDLDALFWPTVSIDLSEGLEEGAPAPGAGRGNGDGQGDGQGNGQGAGTGQGTGGPRAADATTVAAGVLPVTGASLAGLAAVLLGGGALVRRRRHDDLG